MNLAEILNDKDVLDWSEEDLETVIADLRARAEAFATAEATAGATGKKVRTKKPTFTSIKKIENIPEELNSLEFDL